MDGCGGCTTGRHSMSSRRPLKRVKIVNFVLVVFYHESNNNKKFNSSKRHGVKKYTEQPERPHRNSTRNRQKHPKWQGRGYWWTSKLQRRLTAKENWRFPRYLLGNVWGPAASRRAFKMSSIGVTLLILSLTSYLATEQFRSLDNDRKFGRSTKQGSLSNRERRKGTY